MTKITKQQMLNVLATAAREEETQDYKYLQGFLNSSKLTTYEFAPGDTHVAVEEDEDGRVLELKLTRYAKTTGEVEHTDTLSLETIDTIEFNEDSELVVTSGAGFDYVVDFVKCECVNLDNSHFWADIPTD